MATISDIGVPGQPLNTPPLTEWQAAVRDALTPVLGVCTPQAGWVDYGGSWAGTPVTKQGRIVVVDAQFKPAADTAIAAADVTIAALPSWAFPARRVWAPCTYRMAASGFPLAGKVAISSVDGVIQFLPAAAATMVAAGGYIALSMSFRSAT